MMRIIAWSCENIETWLSARVDVTDKSSKFEKFRKNSKKFGNWIYLRYKPPSHPSSKRSKREKGLSIEQLLSVLFRIKVKILPPVPDCAEKNFRLSVQKEEILKIFWTNFAEPESAVFIIAIFVGLFCPIIYCQIMFYLLYFLTYSPKTLGCPAGVSG